MNEHGFRVFRNGVCRKTSRARAYVLFGWQMHTLQGGKQNFDGLCLSNPDSLLDVIWGSATVSLRVLLPDNLHRDKLKTETFIALMYTKSTMTLHSNSSNPCRV